jgi:hypothetical protein
MYTIFANAFNSIFSVLELSNIFAFLLFYDKKYF